jgi:hypothetical protein
MPLMVTLRYLAKGEGTPKVLANALVATLDKVDKEPGLYTDVVDYLIKADALGYIFVIASKDSEDPCTWIQSTGKFERAFRGE